MPRAARRPSARRRRAPAAGAGRSVPPAELLATLPAAIEALIDTTRYGDWGEVRRICRVLAEAGRDETRDLVRRARAVVRQIDAGDEVHLIRPRVIRLLSVCRELAASGRAPTS